MSRPDALCCADFFGQAGDPSRAAERRGGGSYGLQLVKSRKPPIEVEIDPLPQFTVNACRSGACELRIRLGGEESPQRNVPPETINILPPDTAARVSVTSETLSLTAAFGWSELRPLFERHGVQLSSMGRFFGRSHVSPAAFALIDTMWLYAREGGDASSLYIDAATLQLIALLAGHPALGPVGPAGIEDPRVARVVDYIEAHLGDALSLEVLGSVAALSPGHLSRTFKATMGEQVWRYVSRRRCEYAYERLVHTHEPIADIALRCGFAHQSHLSRRIRRHYGVTPAALRRRR